MWNFPTLLDDETSQQQKLEALRKRSEEIERASAKARLAVEKAKQAEEEQKRIEMQTEVDQKQRALDQKQRALDRSIEFGRQRTAWERYTEEHTQLQEQQLLEEETKASVNRAALRARFDRGVSLYQDPGRGIGEGKIMPGTLLIQGRASSVLLRGEALKDAPQKEEEEKAQNVHRAKAREMYINAVLIEAWRKLRAGDLNGARLDRAKVETEFAKTDEDNDELTFTENEMLLIYAARKKKDLETFDHEVLSAQRLVYLTAGNLHMKVARQMLHDKDFEAAKNARSRAAVEFARAKQDASSTLFCDVAEYKEIVAFDQELSKAKSEAEAAATTEAEAKAKAEAEAEAAANAVLEKEKAYMEKRKKKK